MGGRHSLYSWIKRYIKTRSKRAIEYRHNLAGHGYVFNPRGSAASLKRVLAPARRAENEDIFICL